MVGTQKLSTPDGDMLIYDAMPDRPAANGVIVFHDGFGATDHLRDVLERLSALGYRAVGPHLFHRTGDPRIDYSDLDEARRHMSGLTQDGLLADTDATLEYLADAGMNTKQVAALGFCMGGSVSFLAAASRPLGAAVSFYGGGVSKGRFGMPPLVELASELQSPWLGLFGDLDPTISAAEVESLRVKTREAPVRSEIVRYPDAGHAFFQDQRSSYHEASARDAWARTLSWLNECMSPLEA